MTDWDRIVDWCGKNAPETAAAILAPISQEEQWKAERETGGWAWPEQLSEFYERCNGLERTPAGYLFPDLRPLSLEEVVDVWEMMVVTDAEVFQGKTIPDLTGEERKTYLANLVVGDDPEVRGFYAEPAGTPVGRYIAPWLPIAEDQSGSYLVVDRRGGRRSGCLVEIDKVDFDHQNARRWSGLRALLKQVADALETGKPVKDGNTSAEAVSGRITWT